MASFCPQEAKNGVYLILGAEKNREVRAVYRRSQDEQPNRSLTLEAIFKRAGSNSLALNPQKPTAIVRADVSSDHATAVSDDGGGEVSANDASPSVHIRCRDSSLMRCWENHGARWRERNPA